MFTTHRAARILPVAAVLLTVGACRDTVIPTAPLALHPSFTQVAASPVVNSLADPGDGTCDDTQCTLREALAFASSGAVITFNVTGTITLTSYLDIVNPVTISGPGADQLSVSGGGASQVFTNDANGAIISGITITGGYVTAGGGAGVTNYGTLTLIDCAITGNNAYYNQGGGIRNNGTILVKSSTISNNTGHYSASGFANTGTAVFVNSTVSGSLATGGGPGIGIFNGSGTLRLINSTVTGNSYGVQTYTTATTTEIKNSLMWGNTVYDVAEYTNGLTTSLGYNLIGVTESAALTTEFSNTGDQTGVTNAHIGALTVNSPGHTATHALLTGSTAIDAGSCTDNLAATITTDQRGVSRPQGSACDIGAYELQPTGSLDPGFTFDVSALGTVTYGNVPFGINSFAHTNSSGYISFVLGSGSVGCSVSTGGTVTITGAAIDPSHCIIEASVAADATYSAAGPISQSFNIAKAIGSVSINNIPSSAAVGGSFTPAYTKAGDGTASTVSNSNSVCTVTNGVVDFVATGTCLLQASVTAGTNHLAATGSEQNFTISLVTPTFAFDLSGLSKTFGDGNFSVAPYATTNSTGAVTFGLGAGSVGCSVTSAGLVTITGAAVDPVHCVLSATLAADGSYAAAGPLKDSVNIAKASTTVSINNMPASATVGDHFTPTFTTSSDGTVSVASLTTGVCTVTSGVVNFIAAGTCTLRALVTEGTNHQAATGSQQNITVSPAPLVFSSSCTYTINAKNDQRQVTVSWTNADPGVTQIQVADGRIVTKQLAPTPTGSWSTNVKTGIPTYGLFGGTSRRANTTTLVAAGTACSQVQ